MEGIKTFLQKVTPEEYEILKQLEREQKIPNLKRLFFELNDYIKGKVMPHQPEQINENLETLPQPTAATTSKSMSTMMYKTIDKFQWSDEGKHISLYLPLNGVGQLPKENVEISFSKKSLQVSVHDLKGYNYRFSLLPLYEEIDPAKSIYLIKPNRIFLKLIKIDDKHWMSLQKSAADKVKSPKFDSKEDPSSGLMGMLKNLYDQGDDEMKRQLAKSWHESQQKMASGNPVDMPDFKSDF